MPFKRAWPQMPLYQLSFLLRIKIVLIPSYSSLNSSSLRALPIPSCIPSSVLSCRPVLSDAPSYPPDPAGRFCGYGLPMHFPMHAACIMLCYPFPAEILSLLPAPVRLFCRYLPAESPFRELVSSYIYVYLSICGSPFPSLSFRPDLWSFPLSGAFALHNARKLSPLSLPASRQGSLPCSCLASPPASASSVHKIGRHRLFIYVILKTGSAAEQSAFLSYDSRRKIHEP